MTESGSVLAHWTGDRTRTRSAAPIFVRGAAANRRLVVVSNRVTPTAGARPDSGGLAVAIRAALHQSGGIWFGWSGEVHEYSSTEPGISTDGPLTFATLGLSQQDFDEY